MKNKFMSEEVKMWKFGCFLGYNALALYSMNKYVRHFITSRRKKLTTKL